MPVISIKCLGSNGNYQLGLNHDKDIDEPETTLRCYVKPELASDIYKPFLNGKELGSSEKPTDECDLYRLGFAYGSVFPVKIACGGNHTVVLLSNGAVIATGLNEQGQLILDSTVSENKVLRSWRIIYNDSAHPAIDIACCWESTVIAVVDQTQNSQNDFTDIHIKSFGTGMKGELGLGNKISFNKDELRDVLALKSSSPISLLSSMANVIVLDKQAKVCYGWGNNTKNQLLLPEANENLVPTTNKLYKKRTKIVWEPVQINKAEEFESNTFTLGKDFLAWVKKNSAHLTFEASGSLDMQTGLLNILKSKVDAMLSTKSEFQILKMESMWSSVHILFKQDNDTVKIMSLGKGRHGQLSMNDKLLHQYRDFSCGSEHGIFCNENNEVYCWGWGEHGNCGKRNPKRISEPHATGISQDATVWENLNLVFCAESNEHVLFVQGGCATTFIVSMAL